MTPDARRAIYQTKVSTIPSYQPEAAGAVTCLFEPFSDDALLEAERHDLLLEFGCLQFRHVQADNDRRCLAEPATGRRTRNPEIRGDGHVPGVADELSKPVVVALLPAPRSRHEDESSTVRSRRSTSRRHCEPRRETAAAVTTTRAGRCRMSVRIARLISRPWRG